MKILRRGASANHGERGITIDELSFAWQVANETMQAKSSKAVYDFATNGRHRYRILIELDEIAAMIEALASSLGEVETEKVRAIIRPKVADLLKIANIASHA